MCVQNISHVPNLMMKLPLFTSELHFLHYHLVIIIADISRLMRLFSCVN